jgi:hypothetical protein
MADELLRLFSTPLVIGIFTALVIAILTRLISQFYREAKSTEEVKEAEREAFKGVPDIIKKDTAELPEIGPHDITARIQHFPESEIAIEQSGENS